MSKQIDLAKKLLALAQKGVGGEKKNAASMLDALMKKHGLTIEDIEGEAISRHFFMIKKNEGRLMHQIVKRVNRKIKCYELPMAKVRQLKISGNYMIEATVAEYVEIESMFAVYNRLYKKELEIFYTAFLNANDLLVTPDDPKSASDLTPEELDEWMRMKRLSNNIEKGNFRKQIAQAH